MRHYKYSTQNLNMNIYRAIQNKIYNNLKSAKAIIKSNQSYSLYFSSILTPKHLSWLWFLFALFMSNTSNNCLCINSILSLLKIFITITIYLGLLTFSGLYMLENILIQKKDICKTSYLISLFLIISGFVLAVHTYPQIQAFALYMILIYFIKILYAKSISNVFSIILTSTIPFTQMLMIYVLTCVKQSYFLLFGIIYVMIILYKIMTD